MRIFSIRFAAALVALLGWISPSIAAEPNWPDQMTLGTASPGGTYYVYGEGIANILTRALDLPVVRQATEGPLQNIELMEAGQIQLGFVTMGVALQAWNASGVWTGRAPARAMRAIFPMYDTPFQFLVLEQSGIRSIADIAGKRVGVGPHGGTSATYAPRFFSVLNVAAEFIYGDYADLATQLQNRQIDAFFAAAGAPFPSFIALEAKTKVRYLTLSSQQIASLRLAMPELSPSRVPAGTYPSLLRHYDTVGLYNFAVARAELPADLVYQIVKTVFDKHEELMAVHPAAAATIPANIDHNSFLILDNHSAHISRETKSLACRSAGAPLRIHFHPQSRLLAQSRRGLLLETPVPSCGTFASPPSGSSRIASWPPWIISTTIPSFTPWTYKLDKAA